MEWERYVLPLKPTSALILSADNDFTQWLQKFNTNEQEKNDLVYVNSSDDQQLYLHLAEAYKRVRKFGMIVVDAPDLNSKKLFFLHTSPIQFYIHHLYNKCLFVAAKEAHRKVRCQASALEKTIRFH